MQRASTDWWIATINMVGSIFFMASALAAFVLPDTGDLLDASLANTGTFLGALCFFWAARLLVVGEPDRPSTPADRDHPDRPDRPDRASRGAPSASRRPGSHLADGMV